MLTFSKIDLAQTHGPLENLQSMPRGGGNAKERTVKGPTPGVVMPRRPRLRGPGLREIRLMGPLPMEPRLMEIRPREGQG